MISGYEQIYLDMLPALRNCDLAESAQRLGLTVLANGSVIVRFCGREYSITSAGVTPIDGLPVDVNYRSVLAYYILSEGRGEPEGAFVPLAKLTGMIAGQNSHSQGLFVRPLIEAFGDDCEKFQAAARQLDGVPDGALPDGGQCWRFAVLPKIPVCLICYPADEEFPPDIQLWFDRSAPRFLAFERLAFLSGCFTKALLMAVKNGSRGREESTGKTKSVNRALQEIVPLR
jgi:hypothetical protein